MADDMLSIGAFSRASSISVRTLRNYHEAGLLVPASVDAGTGYRFYSADQLADALVIVRLRELDVPLPSIHRILTARDPEETRAVLSDHRATMQARLSEAERIVAALQRGTPSLGNPVHLTTTSAQHVLATTADVPSAALWSWLTASVGTLVAVASSVGTVTGPPGALYLPELLDESQEHVTAYVPVAGPVLVPETVPGVVLGEIPATTWATLSHTGGFDTVSETYRILGAWVARKARPLADRRICERYPGLADGGSGGSGGGGSGGGDDDEIVEICWPIEEGVPPSSL